MAVSTFQTANYHGYSVRFSPLLPDRIAVATCESFGITGGGKLFLLQLTSETALVPLVAVETKESLFDVAWSESDPNIVAVACGDGTLTIFRNIDNACLPIYTFKSHANETSSVDYTPARIPQQQHILSASWDRSVKVWNGDLLAPNPVRTFNAHAQIVYSARWSPFRPGTFASVSGDGFAHIWTMRTQQNGGLVLRMRAHDGEVLTCDWSGRDEFAIATGGTDGIVRVWDLRSFAQPMTQLLGSAGAVKRVRFSPHRPGMIAAVGYDCVTKCWDIDGAWKSDPVASSRQHTEFVYGLDWDRFQPGRMVDCAWDSLIHVYHRFVE